MARIIGVDVGGTFTDVVIHTADSIVGFKVPTTMDQAEGVAGSVEWTHDDTLLHGTTAATNALLQERGARVALVTEAGFEDLVEIGRQDRPSLYDSSVDRPVQLVEQDARVDDPSLLDDRSPDIVVVGLIDAYRDPEAERQLAAKVRGVVGVPVIEATTVSPEFREYERLATAILSAYLTPSVADYLSRLGASVESPALVMTSGGGLLPFDQGAANAARLVLSGPAGGVVAAAALARHHGLPEVISFDMGGTSTDVCRISGGVVSVASGHRVAGRVNRVPSVPVRTIGAGGGSVGWVDSGGALRVGPRSAGSIPGPAAYGFGGVEPTVTDANLALGHITAAAAFGEAFTLDVERSREALATLEVTGLDVEGVARGMLEVVDSHMEHALRAVSVEEGVDPRDTVMVAFGGAGGLHAVRLARRLGIPRVLIPPLSGVFSALGLLLAAPTADAVRTVMLSENDGRLFEAAARIEAEASARFDELFASSPTATGISFDCRYSGQSHEIEVSSVPDWESIRRTFEDAHLRQFGFVREGEPIEAVNVRARATGAAPFTWDQLAGTVFEPTPSVLVEEADRVERLDDGTVEVRCG